MVCRQDTATPARSTDLGINNPADTPTVAGDHPIDGSPQLNGIASTVVAECDPAEATSQGRLSPYRVNEAEMATVCVAFSPTSHVHLFDFHQQ
jgi:hypothetical protein